jgi:hypothetical protein
LLIVIVGIIVGVVVITMYLPIFYLGDAICTVTGSSSANEVRRSGS